MNRFTDSLLSSMLLVAKTRLLPPAELLARAASRGGRTGCSRDRPTPTLRTLSFNTRISSRVAELPGGTTTYLGETLGLRTLTPCNTFTDTRLIRGPVRQIGTFLSKPEFTPL